VLLKRSDGVQHNLALDDSGLFIVI
jgi:hypothetical protein